MEPYDKANLKAQGITDIFIINEDQHYEAIPLDSLLQTEFHNGRYRYIYLKNGFTNRSVWHRL
jgi:hypothetical protein